MRVPISSIAAACIRADAGMRRFTLERLARLDLSLRKR
jgi:hypothetical protein